MLFGAAHASVRRVRKVGVRVPLAHSAAAHSARLQALGHQAARTGSQPWASLRTARCSVPLRSACWSLELLPLLLLLSGACMGSGPQAVCAQWLAHRAGAHLPLNLSLLSTL